MRAFTCLIRPFYDRLDVTIPWLFYPAPAESSDGPATWITPRWWDEREHWESIGVGIVYGSQKPYFGPVPHRPRGPIVGTPEMWRDGLSYAVWQAGGYSDPVGCWPAPRPLTVIKLNQRQRSSWVNWPTYRTNQLQSLTMRSGAGIRMAQVQGLRLYVALGGAHQLQSLRLNPRQPMGNHQLQSLSLSPTEAVSNHQLQSLTLSAGMHLEAHQLQSLTLPAGMPIGMHQLESLGLSPTQTAGHNQLESLTMVGGPELPISMNQLESLTMTASNGRVYTGGVIGGFNTIALTSSPSPPIPAGWNISGPGVAPGTTVVSCVFNTVTMSGNATTSASGSYTFTP